MVLWLPTFCLINWMYLVREHRTMKSLLNVSVFGSSVLKSRQCIYFLFGDTFILISELESVSTYIQNKRISHFKIVLKYFLVPHLLSRFHQRKRILQCLPITQPSSLPKLDSDKVTLPHLSEPKGVILIQSRTLSKRFVLPCWL